MGGALRVFGKQNTQGGTKDKALTDFLTKQYESENAVTKILLLGTGNSGKSTILKQFQYLHEENFYDEEKLKSLKYLVSENMLDGIRQLVEAAFILADEKHILKAKIADKTRTVYDFLFDVPSTDLSIWQQVSFEGRPRGVDSLLHEIWGDEAIQEVLISHAHILARTEIPIGYFMKGFQRITRKDYIPTPDDILNSRKRTTGVVEVNFKLDGNACNMFDVGGQRNERNKWISHFDNVDVVIYLVSMADYCKILYEDESENRLRESLTVFKEIISGPFFGGTDILLFMNKKDLFEELVGREPIKKYFPEYQGSNSIEDGIEFLKLMFISEYKKIKEEKAISNADIYVYQTMATNTENIKVVLGLCKHIILRKNLANIGIF